MENLKNNPNNNDGIEKLIRRINEWKEQPKVYIVNRERMNKAYELQQKIQEILDEENLKTKVRIKPAPLGMGSAVIEFDSYYIANRNTGGIVSILSEFNNFEFSIRGDKVHFAGMIHNVAKVKLINE